MQSIDIKKFHSLVSKLPEEYIFDLAIKEAGQINNVITGIQRHCFGIALTENTPNTYLLYINGHKTLKGYMLRLTFKQDDYYDYVMAFTYYISLEFPETVAIELYNTFLYQLRAELENRGIMTLSSHEVQELIDRTGDPNPMMIAHGGIEIIPFFDAKEFYCSLLSVSKLPLVVEGCHYVYVIINTRTGFFKIGRSRNPMKREKTLQSEEPDIALLFYQEAEVQFERILQRCFKNKRVRGEWFRLGIDDLFKLSDLFATKKATDNNQSKAE